MSCQAIEQMVNNNNIPSSSSKMKISFKCENFQRVGAFKFRGACNAVACIPEEIAKAGVATHSAGNFAQALALAAKLRGIPSHVVIPKNAPKVKKEAVRGYGGIIRECEPTLQAREDTCNQVIQETNATFVHSFNNAQVISGNGCILLEWASQVAEIGLPPLDAIIVPVGGGGLLAGCCIAGRSLNPNIHIFAAEPLGADDCKKSFDQQRFVPQKNPVTIADGLRTSLGDLTWPIIKDHIEDVIVVTEDQIKAAMRLVFERMKIVIEPSSAVAVAALLECKSRLQSLNIKHVGVLLSGGNVDLDCLNEFISH